jgi:hypothetical protein
MAYNNAANIDVTGIVNADGSGDFNGNNLDATGNTISSTDTNGNIILAPNGTGDVSITTAPLVPSTDRADSLGSATNSWDNVYADGLSFNDGTDVMDTYEEGTWTPTIRFGGGTTGITYGEQYGFYTKIGDLVFYNCKIVLTAKGTSTGNLSMVGLGFTPSDFYNGMIKTAFLTYTGTDVIPVIRDASGFNILFQVMLSGGIATNLTDTSCANNTQIFVTGSFTV